MPRFLLRENRKIWETFEIEIEAANLADADNRARDEINNAKDNGDGEYYSGEACDIDEENYIEVIEQ